MKIPLLNRALAPEGFPALAFLLLLIVEDWVLARHLRSPTDLVPWLSEFVDIEITTDPDALDPLWTFLGSPYFGLALVALLLVLWVFGGRRWLLVPLLIYLLWATSESIAALVVVGVNLFNPNTAAEVLLIDTLIIWVSNGVVFAAWYWLIDHTGQGRYSTEAPVQLDFVFPQTGSALPAWDHWRPGVFDYLYLSFIVMAQFGPNDAIPLTRRAKTIVMIKTVVALLSVTLIASRAIGLVK
jgi:hypothetical protein